MCPVYGLNSIYWIGTRQSSLTDTIPGTWSQVIAVYGDLWPTSYWRGGLFPDTAYIEWHYSYTLKHDGNKTQTITISFHFNGFLNPYDASWHEDAFRIIAPPVTSDNKSIILLSQPSTIDATANSINVRSVLLPLCEADPPVTGDNNSIILLSQFHWCSPEEPR